MTDTGIPRRVQYRRGQPKPAGTELVGRPHRFGNPFDWRTLGAHEAVRRYGEWIVNPDSQPIRCGAVLYRPATVDIIQARLRGKDLACYCKPGDPCHADVLIMIANR
jgi:hypothetical protein